MDRQLAAKMDAWITREPDYYDGVCEDEEHDICEECGECHICDPKMAQKCKDDYEMQIQMEQSERVERENDYEDIVLSDEEVKKWTK